MSASKKQFLSAFSWPRLTIVMMALGALLTFQSAALDQLQIQLEKSRRDLANHRAKITALQQRNKTNSVTTAAATTQGDGREVTLQDQEDAKFALKLSKDPAHHAFEIRDTRVRLLQRYGDALELLNVSPETLARLKDLLVEQEQREDEARLTAQAAGGPITTVEAAATRARAVSQDEIEAILGSDVMHRLGQIQSALSFHNIAEQFGVSLEEKGMKLSRAQNEILAEALAAAWKEFESPVEQFSTVLVNRLHGSLSSEQIEVVRQIAELHHYSRQQYKD